MRVNRMAQPIERAAAVLADRDGAPFADRIHDQDRGALEGTGEEAGGGVRFVVWHVANGGFAEPEMLEAAARQVRQRERAPPLPGKRLARLL